MTDKKLMVKCKVCGTGEFVEYVPEVDAYACMRCDVWLEDVCGDKKCKFCGGRTYTPGYKRDKEERRREAMR